MGTHSHTQASLTLLRSQSSPQSHIVIAKNIYSKESPPTSLAAVGGGRGGRGRLPSAASGQIIELWAVGGVMHNWGSVSAPTPKRA